MKQSGRVAAAESKYEVSSSTNEAIKSVNTYRGEEVVEVEVEVKSSMSAKADMKMATM